MTHQKSLNKISQLSAIVELRKILLHTSVYQQGPPDIVADQNLYTVGSGENMGDILTRSNIEAHSKQPTICLVGEYHSRESGKQQDFIRHIASTQSNIHCISETDLDYLNNGMKCVNFIYLFILGVFVEDETLHVNIDLYFYGLLKTLLIFHNLYQQNTLIWPANEQNIELISRFLIKHSDSSQHIMSILEQKSVLTTLLTYTGRGDVFRLDPTKLSEYKRFRKEFNPCLSDLASGLAHIMKEYFDSQYGYKLPENISIIKTLDSGKTLMFNMSYLTEVRTYLWNDWLTQYIENQVNRNLSIQNVFIIIAGAAHIFNRRSDEIEAKPASVGLRSLLKSCYPMANINTFCFTSAGQAPLLAQEFVDDDLSTLTIDNSLNQMKVESMTSQIAGLFFNNSRLVDRTSSNPYNAGAVVSYKPFPNRSFC